MLDKRLNAYRNDLADIRLKSQVEAKVFREGAVMQMLAPIATLHRAPAFDAPQDTQVLMGEIVRVFDVTESWAWVQLQRDSYVGYMRHEMLNAKVLIPTHKVTVPSTLLYTRPNIKTQPVQFLPMNTEVTIAALQDDFYELATGGFVFVKHLQQKHTDFVSVAEQFLHTPYYWGGKSYHGIDCSGLVQTSLQACGIKVPRDTDMQEKELGTIVSQENLKRGDLVFWSGHVGIMQDATTLLHASGHQMMVVSEPLAIVDERTKAKGKEISSIRRILL